MDEEISSAASFAFMRRASGAPAASSKLRSSSVQAELLRSFFAFIADAVRSTGTAATADRRALGAAAEGGLVKRLPEHRARARYSHSPQN